MPGDLAVAVGHRNLLIRAPRYHGGFIARIWAAVGCGKPRFPTLQIRHNSLAFENANELTRRVFSSRINVRVIGGSARWLQFSRSQSRQLTPIGVPSALSRSMPVA